MPKKETPFELLRRAARLFKEEGKFIDAARKAFLEVNDVRPGRGIQTTTNKITKARVGRKPQFEADRNAIAEIARVNAGVSESDYHQWTQSDWVKAVLNHKKEPGSGTETIKKSLKKIIRRTLLPINLIPNSITQKESLTFQLSVCFGHAILKASVLMNDRKSMKPSSDFQTVNAIHRRLCAERIMKKMKLTEELRQAWLLDQWGKTKSIPIESRKLTPSPSAKE